MAIFSTDSIVTKLNKAILGAHEDIRANERKIWKSPRYSGRRKELSLINQGLLSKLKRLDLQLVAVQQAIDADEETKISIECMCHAFASFSR